MSPGGMLASMIVNAPPKLSAVTLWVMSKTRRWAPSSGPMKIFLFSLAATFYASFHFACLTKVSYTGSEALCVPPMSDLFGLSARPTSEQAPSDTVRKGSRMRRDAPMRAAEKSVICPVLSSAYRPNSRLESPSNTFWDGSF